jgi:hypothetical protein
MKKYFLFAAMYLFSAHKMLKAQSITIDSVNNKITLATLSIDSIENASIDSNTIALWNKVVANGLNTPLWAKDNAYNAGHFYMLPLHAAFQFNNYEWQQQFAQHFERFVVDGYFDVEPTQLYRLQYYYLASWFMVLAIENGQDSLIPAGLFDIVYDDIDNFWNNEPVNNWRYPGLSLPNFNNLRSRVLWKLYNVQVPEKTFHRAIIDAEKFTFAIAANLKTYMRYTETDTLPKSQTVDDILEFAYIFFNKRVEWNETGGWLLQPGFWTNHDDYKYAGNNSKNNVQIKPVENIAEDVSHSHRTALWLKSFVKASDENERGFYDSLLAGLEKQFFEYALLPPNDLINTYHNHNFMDGNNGLYRWNYHKDRPNTGYGAYELSGTMLIGWWTFLDTPRIKEVYNNLSQRFPIPDNILAMYQLKTGEVPLKDEINSWYLNGWAELNTRLAALLR